MKYVLNKCFGGFGLNEETLEKLGARWSGDVDRQDPRLIEMVEQDSASVSGDFAELEVIEIPDEATDWEVDEYDGIESITYVLDGRLHHI